VHNQDYIVSGVLELYAAGGLTQEGREEVERRAADSPEVRLALEEACAAMEGYASQYAVRPRPALKDRIMSQIGHTPIAESELPQQENEVPVRPLYAEDRKENAPYKWTPVASIALVLLSGIFSLYFYNKWQQAEERLAGVIASESLLARNFQQTSLQLQNQEQMLAILRNPAFRPVRLQGVEAHPEASMTVYWNASEQQVYVDQVALPKPPSGKQYQLWALADGKPIDAGMIESLDGNTGLQQMKNIGAAQAFAVTLEPTGGSESPTLEELRVMGQIGS
jgi:anti-sigma-K factor RskA